MQLHGSPPPAHHRNDSANDASPGFVDSEKLVLTTSFLVMVDIVELSVLIVLDQMYTSAVRH